MNRISFLDFLKTGNFGNVKLSCAKLEVMSLISSNIETNFFINSEILKYGDIEFHFSNDELIMIFCDSLKFAYENLNLGSGIDFDCWIFKKGKIYSFRQIAEELKKESIIFVPKERNGNIEILLESRVKLIFENDNNNTSEIDDYLLVGFEFSIFNI